MIEINLLPDSSKKKESIAGDSKHAGAKKFELVLSKPMVVKMVCAGAGLVIILQIALFLTGLLSRARDASLEKIYTKMLPQIEEAARCEADSGSLKKKNTAIDSLMIRRFSWSNALNDISDSIIPGVWLSGMMNTEALRGQSGEKAAAGKSRGPSGKTVLRYLVLDGYTAKSGEEGTALVGKFIHSLRSNRAFYSGFSGIELVSIKSDKFENQDVMNFRIACLFKD